MIEARTAPGKILERIRSAAPDAEALSSAILRLVRARMYRATQDDVNQALRDVGRIVARQEAAADLIARAAMRLGLRGPTPRTVSRFADAGGPSLIDLVRFDGDVPRILPRDALAELLDREPILARSAEEVARIYSEKHAFAAARSIDVTVTKRVRDEIEKGLRLGRGEREASLKVADLADWSLGYAQTVVRTNVTGAYASGRFREAEILTAEGTPIALRFTASMDANTRPNHAAADGLYAAVGDPIWDKLSPGLGYNCRCGLEATDPMDIPASVPRYPDGRLKPARTPSGAHADRGPHGEDMGFGRRPDTIAYLAGLRAPGG